MASIRYATILTGAALMLGLTLGGSSVRAQSANVGLSVPKFQEPVFCYGADDFGECRLFAGTAESCQHLEPCNWEKTAQFVPLQDPTFCYGADDFGRCHLYLGTDKACASLEPCVWSVNVKILPQRD